MRRRASKVSLLGLTGVVALLTLACALGQSNGSNGAGAAADPHLQRRLTMVALQIEARGVRDERVLQALREVPRHLFVPPHQQDQAYTDRPLPIGQQQTISQPYIVALMTELARPRPGMKVLEVGTGSGYQAAVLAKIVDQVYTIEILPDLGRTAAELLRELGYNNVQARIGDGFDGWPEHAPFDAVIVTASPLEIPKPLLEQLAVGGRLVIPVGQDSSQDLVVVTRTEQGYERSEVIPVRFVPMTGKAQEDP